MIKEVYDKCHAELDEDDGFQSFGNGEDISLPKGNNNTTKKKDCC